MTSHDARNPPAPVTHTVLDVAGGGASMLSLSLSLSPCFSIPASWLLRLIASLASGLLAPMSYALSLPIATWRETGQRSIELHKLISTMCSLLFVDFSRTRGRGPVFIFIFFLSFFPVPYIQIGVEAPVKISLLRAYLEALFVAK